jgi:acyl carrier protein
MHPRLRFIRAPGGPTSCLAPAMDDTFDKISRAFIEVMKIDPARITDALAYGECPEWDSLAHMALVTELESAFGVMLDTEDIIAMSSVAEIKRILAKQGVAA